MRNKMAISTYLFTLNANELNAPNKTHKVSDRIKTNKQKIKTRTCNNMLLTRESLQG